MPSKGTPHRTVRIEDGLWDAAKEAAKQNGTNISEVIREALSAYVRDMGDPSEHQ